MPRGVARLGTAKSTFTPGPQGPDQCMDPSAYIHEYLNLNAQHEMALL
jgi:hypothetical protein